MYDISDECAKAFVRWLEDGKVLDRVYAANASKGGGINFRNAENQRWQINNDGKMVSRDK